jgi:hypothetical protein
MSIASINDFQKIDQHVTIIAPLLANSTAPLGGILY